MSESWGTGIVPGYETKIVQVGNCTVRIHSPILDAKEKERREEELKNALANLGRSMNHEKIH